MSGLERSESSTTTSTRSRRAPTVAPQQTHVHTVLVVDDERGVRDALRLILEPHFRVLTADRGTVALKMLEKGPVSVMTLDLRMPGWSGPETLLNIRETYPDLEVVIVSAYASYTEAMRALRLRAFDLIAKPFDSTELLETVRRAAQRCETRRGLSSSYEVLEGLTNRLIESIPGLTAGELGKLARSKAAKLEELRALAQHFQSRLSPR